ncbi:MAG: uroporphyrinogen decarboxylase family protein [Chthoniobacteraceae bacterium]|nr:uroporphyrinogen decarboxylase family protein [Chthoniobacteraceae bacterium]
MTTSLTSRERVNRMMERRDQDRVPRHESFWPETITRWQGEGLDGGEDTVLERLGSDLASLCWCWPGIYPGAEQIVSEDADTKVVRDSHGKLVRYWKNRSGTPEHLGFECETREIWEKKFKPLLLENWYQIDPAAIKATYDPKHAAGKWTHLTSVEPFEETRAVMGDEITLIAMAEDPEWIRDVAVTFTDVLLRNLDAALSTGIQPDGLWIYGDMAFKSATMCSPAMYRELIWPQHKRIVDWTHAHGMKFIYHTDGNVNGVLDLYTEAGFDCLQPLETKAGMDIRELCPRYGDRLAFFGNIDVMKMITNDLGMIEEEIASKLAAGKATRGYMYHSDHSVPPQVSWKTYQEIIRMVERHGNY